MSKRIVSSADSQPAVTTQKLVPPPEMPTENEVPKYAVPEYPDSIEGLLNGDFQRPTEVMACLWTGEEAFSAGVGLIELRSRTESVPPPWDFIAAYIAATHRNDSVAEELFFAFRRHYGVKEPLWTAAMESEIGRRKRPSRATPQADAVLIESGNEFFSALMKFWEAISLKKKRDDLAGVEWIGEDLLKPRRLLEEALGVFEKTSAFFAGRACKEIYDDTKNLDEQLEFIEQAERHFLKAQHSLMGFRVREARTKNTYLKQTADAGYKNRSLVIGDRLRAIEQARTVKEFAEGVVQFLNGPEIYGLDSVIFLRDEDGEVIAKSGNPNSGDYSVEITMGNGFMLRFPARTDLTALNLIIPALKTALSNLSDRLVADRYVLPIVFGPLKFYDPGYIPVVEFLKKAAESPNQNMLLLLGNTGTGKTMCAKAVHEVGRFSNKQFVKVNSADAHDETHFKAMLLGAVKGAWTGNPNEFAGNFKLAQEGTLFLEEIGEISDGIASWLLDILEERLFNVWGRPGEGSPILCRVIGATNAPWEKYALQQEEEIEKHGHIVTHQKGFRLDLYYRFIFRLPLPDLKDVPKQIPYVADTFAVKYKVDLSNDCMAFINNYSWPGNMRQMARVIEAAALLKGTVRTITLDDLLFANPSLRNHARPRNVVTGPLRNKPNAPLEAETPASRTGSLPESVGDSTSGDPQEKFLSLFRDLIGRLPKPHSKHFTNSELATISRLKTQHTKIRNPAILRSIVEALRTLDYCRDEEGGDKLARLVELFYEVNPDLRITGDLIMT